MPSPHVPLNHLPTLREGGTHPLLPKFQNPGLEIAGVVLGVLPLAIEALEKYGEVARRLNHFYKIRTEYQEWHRQLKYNLLLYERNLKELLLSLMIDDETEKDKIPDLIKDPFGTWWTEPKTARLLQERLRDGYEVYMDCIQVIKQVMEAIVQELALRNPSVQSMMNASGEATIIARLKALRESDNWSFQRFRFTFAFKGDEKRTRLFSKLEDYNRKLRDLLAGSDRLRDLSAQIPVAAQPKTAAIDTALCNFWVTADKFFHTIASSWNCRCKTHCANLLLRHRSDATPEFEVLFTKEQPSLTTWNARKTKIVGKNGLNSEPEEEAQTRMSLPIHTPSHKDSRPLKSALGNPKKGKGKTAMFSGSQEVTIGSSTTMTLVQVKQKDEITIASTGYTTRTTSQQIIHCLCTALETPQVSSEIPDEQESSYGYLVSKDIAYHIYDVPYYRPTQHHIAITLQDIIDADLFQNLERRQRFSLALTIASSFVQLLGSPWLPTTTITKTGIIFLVDPNSTAHLLAEDEPAFLNEPYVQHPFVGKNPSHKHGPHMPKGTSFDQLGIILLELCFGKRLRDQPCRRRYDDKFAASNDDLRAIYDVAAAKDWQGKVLGEAGPDYAAAVNWCLGGNRGYSGSKVNHRDN
ncbi:hypothetical protein NEUTE1DRAFT_144828 [Neurospora tetrasperma FGSC 2508]|uniref:DUF7580 domain-containing protein n=1 Tax=Neurospora tetrasperma (strain FGSC 2508 / ATCC MYA-4615 / P0657) TaxID=510951 RepID=F8MG36_NEUT8|nr:uncharacterized protein NEUTE1DRAFT_144828 [Neurospora tetrasperma FGSC 2508]EGO58564.1 hypothetical protein NEUTE1DRAFT_144828 [Neurospora tetrasperma FGSC 2508]